MYEIVKHTIIKIIQISGKNICDQKINSLQEECKLK